MNRLKYLALLFLAALWLPIVYGFSINGAAPGASASMTPVACPTGSPVAAAPCATPGAMGSGILGRAAIEFDNVGSANAYIAPAPVTSLCSAASPAPVASTKAGKWLPPNSSWVLEYNVLQPWGGSVQ